MLNKKIIVVIAAIVLFVSGTTWGKVSQQEAERLKKDLTPFGAERAGNDDGTIPAWDGGIKGIPAGIGYEGPGHIHPNPFKEDKVLFTINGKNIDQYADKLTPGIAALLRKYAQVSLNVYKTRRTASAPQEVYEQTFRNATLCELTEDKEGVMANGALGGVPFPIPQCAQEVVFNHEVRWRGLGMEGPIRNAVVQKNGNTSRGGAIISEYFPWSDSKRPFTGMDDELMTKFTAPARRKGEIVLVLEPLNQAVDPRKAWQYLPGQRRVRRAPTIAFDTPNPSTSGLATYDDSFIFNGSLERYNWKLIGKKEIYIPYNNYRIEQISIDKLLTPLMSGRGVWRWELHRVWVVEATLKEGKRHAYAKRVLFIDEDSWVAVASDAYDSKGNLWRVQWGGMINAYEVPAMVQRIFHSHDLTRDDYFISMINDGKTQLKFQSSVPVSYYSPASLRREGRR